MEGENLGNEARGFRIQGLSSQVWLKGELGGIS